MSRPSPSAVGERFFGTTHQYLDDNPSVTPEDVYKVEIRIVDDDGGVRHGVGRHQGSQHGADDVGGIALGPATTPEGSAASISFSFTDPGTKDTHST